MSFITAQREHFKSFKCKVKKRCYSTSAPPFTASICLSGKRNGSVIKRPMHRRNIRLMKSSFLPWLPARLVFCLASTISQHEAVKWNSAGKTIRQPPHDGASCTFSSTHTKISGKQRRLKGEGRILILYVHIESLSCKWLISEWHGVILLDSQRRSVCMCWHGGSSRVLDFFCGDMKGSEQGQQVLEHRDIAGDGKGG